MKNRLFFLLLLFVGLHTTAQSINGIDNTFSIKLNPLALIDVYGSYSYRIGTEFKIHKNYAASIEVGNYFNYGKKDGIRDNSKGYIVKPEIKMYLNKEGLSSGVFVSIEYEYKKIAFNYGDSISLPPTPTYYKEYRIYKDISCITLKYGQLKVYRKRFLLEWFLGAGIRICKGSNTLPAVEDNAILTGENHGSEIGWGQRNVNYVLPNFSIGLKLGYSFR